MEHIVSAYKQTRTRAILLDYDGTLMPQSSIDKSSSSKTIEMLNTLGSDKNNMVFIVSVRSRSTLGEWFASCEKLGLAAEHGCFLRLGDSSNLWSAKSTLKDRDLASRTVLFSTCLKVLKTLDDH
ncbi:alpha,alpha-trehalose-phosphate synthase [UDP-forming] 6-like protein, partial [Tanacetum coccineum]